jgi:hypothetical protein
MAATAIALRERRASLVGTLTGDVFALGSLAGLGVLLATITWASWGDLGQDTGYDLVAGSRVAHGELPYVDFTYYYGPLAPLLSGAASYLGGTSALTAASVLGLLLTVAVVGGTYALARTQVAPIGALIAATITAALAFAPTNLSYVLPHTLSATLAVALTLAFLLAVARHAATHHARWLIAAGAGAGCVALTRPEFVLAVGAAAVAWLGARIWSRQSGLRDVVAFLAPALAIPLAAYAGFVAAGVSLHALLFDNLYPVDVLHAGGNTVLHIAAPFTISSFASIGLKLVLYAGGAVALIALGALISISRSARIAALVLPALAVAVAVADPEAARTGLQYAYGWIPLGAALGCAGLVMSRMRRRDADSPADQVWLATIVVLAMLAAKTYGAFFFHSVHAQAAVYAAPFAAIFLVRLHLVTFGRLRGAATVGIVWLAFLALLGVSLTVKDARAKSVSIGGSGGTIRVTPADAALYGPALAAIAAHTRPGEAILVAPQLTALYSLSGRSNPLPQISLLPGALPDRSAELLAARRLEEAGVRFAIVDRNPLAEYGQTSFGGSYDRVLAAWIRSHFVRISTLRPAGPSSHTLDILTRRSS